MLLDSNIYATASYMKSMVQNHIHCVALHGLLVTNDSDADLHVT